MASGNPATKVKPETLDVPKPYPSPCTGSIDEHRVHSPDSSSPKMTTTSQKDFILSAARRISAQSLTNSDPKIWGVLTAISENARKRSQGMNILLKSNEHWLGRLVEDTRFRIEGPAVSAKHCKICRAEDGDPPSSYSILLTDTSTNGTYLNWEKLNKNRSGAKLLHGDIISFVGPPHHELAIAFVYRQACKATCSDNGTILKRKLVIYSLLFLSVEEFGSENKRLKGLGIGAPEGPISLDDVRSLQRSNTELRKQIETHVHTIETLREKIRAAVAGHKNELKQQKESVSNSYLDQINELHKALEIKQKELDEVNAVSAERQHAVEDLSERLAASTQSRTEAGEIINSQKATIDELEAQIDEERTQRREEREEAALDLKAALQKAQLEAQEELQRQVDAASRQQRELQEVISKLQDSDKESRALVETLRTKLEDTRESLVRSEKKVRQLEAQLHEEQLSSSNGRKRAETLECEVKRLRNELEAEKVAREEAWAKVSALELEMSSAIRDLNMEKQRFQDARDKIILRETQLREFYSKTEEITALFVKQQEQLKAMQKTLEDEENYQNASGERDPHAIQDNINGALVREREEPHRRGGATGEASTSTPRNAQNRTHTTSDEASATERNDCEPRRQEDGHTQDFECTSVDQLAKGFGSDIDGVGTAPILDVEPIDTERVINTESEVHDITFGEINFSLGKCNNLGGDTMQLDDEVVQENEEHLERVEDSNTQVEVIKIMEDTEVGTIRTADLLASEVAGSWAVGTAPSVHGENESQRSGNDAGAALLGCSDGQAGGSQNAASPNPSYACKVLNSVQGENESQRSGNDACGALLGCSDGQAAGSQTTPSGSTTKLGHMHKALNDMIGIVAPDLRDQFKGAAGRDDTEPGSDSETEEGSNDADDDDNDDDVMEDDDETQNDSVG